MSRYTLLLGCLLLTGPGAAHAQMRWIVDSRSSLAWWQVSPNLNHLWATTCPGDSSWRPGEGRSSGWYINPKLKLPRTGYANVDDTVHVPLYPRERVYPNCVEAVRGEVVAPDTVHWRGTLATVIVKGEALVTGEAMRDLLMHQVMQTGQFPDIAFSLDSLTDLHRLGGDTIAGKAIGMLTFRDQKYPIVAVLKSYSTPGGMRATGKWRIRAHDLIDMAPKLHYLGLGVNTNIWHDFFMGFDIVFRPAPPENSRNRGSN